MNVCNKCKKPGEFYKDKNAKGGFRGICKSCDIERRIIFAKNNPKQTKKNKQIYRKKHINKIKNERAERAKTGYYTKKQNEWYYRNKYKAIAANAKRRAKKLNATLIGFDEEIKEIYKNRPDGYHVDHIIPLQSQTVSGLHVPWNLQYLTPEENLKKGNIICPEYCL
jgi:5-methylcytosine-specific restriction endonuclease McrA